MPQAKTTRHSITEALAAYAKALADRIDAERRQSEAQAKLAELGVLDYELGSFDSILDSARYRCDGAGEDGEGCSKLFPEFTGFKAPDGKLLCSSCREDKEATAVPAPAPAPAPSSVDEIPF